MNLSPFAQYYVRKLLRQNVDRVSHSFPEDLYSSVFTKLNLNRILAYQYQTQSELSIKVWELETLTNVCQELEKNQYNQDNLIEVKERIFQLLGFKMGVALPSKLPKIIQEKILSPFYFYSEETVLEAVTYECEIHGLVKQLDIAQRLQAYQLSWALSAKDIPHLMTASSSRVAIWIRLRSPTYSIWRDQEKVLSNIIVILYSVLSRSKPFHQ